MFRKAVSVGVMLLCVNLLSLSSLDEHFTAIFLDMLVNGELQDDLLRLGGLVLDDDGAGLILGVLGAARAALPASCFPRRAPQTCP
jgi:hypothetical protein